MRLLAQPGVASEVSDVGTVVLAAFQVVDKPMTTATS
jgi:hypothetical protein